MLINNLKIFKPAYYVGKIYNSWTVLEYVRTVKDKKGVVIRRVFLCMCACGITKSVFLNNLVSGKSSRCRTCANKLHYKDKNSISSNPLYGIWHGMIDRCENISNTSYIRYGGRGIKVCERWYDINNFSKDMLPRPAGLSIERVNNDGNYEPSNCVWATPKEQNSNKQDTHSLTAYNLAKIVGYSRERIRQLKDILLPFVDKTRPCKCYSKVIYKEEAIEFLKHRKTLIK